MRTDIIHCHQLNKEKNYFQITPQILISILEAFSIFINLTFDSGADAINISGLLKSLKVRKFYKSNAIKQNLVA
jgi:hypothetical protein